MACSAKAGPTTPQFSQPLVSKMKEQVQEPDTICSEKPVAPLQFQRLSDQAFWKSIYVTVPLLICNTAFILCYFHTSFPLQPVIVAEVFNIPLEASTWFTIFCILWFSLNASLYLSS